MSGEWDPVHHEEMDAEPDPKPKPKAAAKPKSNGAASKEPALVLTIPPTFAAAMWSLSEALKENTEATRELIKELRAARGE